MPTTTPSERVAAGALFLDFVSPGWPLSIDLDLLDAGVEGCTVLGQVYGLHRHGLLFLQLDAERAVALGFEATADTSSEAFFALPWTEQELRRREADAEFFALTAAWRAVVERRRSGGLTIDESDFAPVDTSPEGSPL